MQQTGYMTSSWVINHVSIPVRLSQADTELRYEHFYTTENKSTTASSYWFSNMGTELGY